MFRRFVSGSAIAAIGIAFGALRVLLAPVAIQQRVFPLLIVWCFVPVAWGLWAMLTPARWVPQRLPLWGAILGLIAGLAAMFVLDLPYRVLGLTLPAIWRGVGIAAIVVFYYLLWMLVRVAYRALGTPASLA